MRPSLRIAVLLLVAVALVGCSRTEPAAPKADNSTAAAKPAGPYLFVAVVEFADDRLQTSEIRVHSSLHELGSSNAAVIESLPGKPKGIIHYDYLSRRPDTVVTMATIRKTPEVSIEVIPSDNSTWLARTVWDDSEGITKMMSDGSHVHQGERVPRQTEFRAEKGATVAMALPDDDHPALAAVLCMLPDIGIRDSQSSVRRNPGNVSFDPHKGPFLLEVAVNLRNPTKPLFGPQLTPLLGSPSYNRERCFKFEGNLPPGSRDLWVSRIRSSRKDGVNELTVHADLTLGQEPYSFYQLDQQLPISNGAIRALVLPDEKGPQYLYLFCILPDVEKNQLEVKP